MSKKERKAKYKLGDNVFYWTEMIKSIEPVTKRVEGFFHVPMDMITEITITKEKVIRKGAIGSVTYDHGSLYHGATCINYNYEINGERIPEREILGKDK